MFCDDDDDDDPNCVVASSGAADARRPADVGVDVEVGAACLICSMLNQKKTKKSCSVSVPTRSHAAEYGFDPFLIFLETVGEKDEYIFKNLLKKKHVCFLLFVLGIFMLPLLLMCQCCGRDLHLATHATNLWCCPRMYQHEIKKPLVIFLYIFPEIKTQFGARVLLLTSTTFIPSQVERRRSAVFFLLLAPPEEKKKTSRKRRGC